MTMGIWNPRANDIFLEAAELHTPEQRRMCLDEACAGNDDLRAQVESLLAAAGQAGHFLESRVGGVDAGIPSALAHSPATDAPAIQAPGTVIGRYRLLERIGEGG